MELMGKMFTVKEVSWPQKLSTVEVPGWANSLLCTRMEMEPESVGSTLWSWTASVG